MDMLYLTAEYNRYSNILLKYLQFRAVRHLIAEISFVNFCEFLFIYVCSLRCLYKVNRIKWYKLISLKSSEPLISFFNNWFTDIYCIVHSIVSRKINVRLYLGVWRFKNRH